METGGGSISSYSDVSALIPRQEIGLLGHAIERIFPRESHLVLLAGIQAVVFDAVGTLIHPEPPASHVYVSCARRFGSTLSSLIVAERFAVAFQREEEADRIAGFRTSEERERNRWRRIVGTVLDDVNDPEACFHELFEHFARPEAWRCEREAVRALEKVADRGYTLALASNYDSRLKQVLAGLPALWTISHVVISSEIGWRKPAPAFFARLCADLALPAEQILYVGDDMNNDYMAAGAAGLRAVLFDPKNRARADVVHIRRFGDLFLE
jgi:putative hydrolase of the HAD superfamily